MERVCFHDFEDFACEIASVYDSCKNDDFEDIAVIAKYDETRQIVRELLCLGYNIHSVNIIDKEYGEYDKEYIISLYDDEIWCEPMLRKNGYIADNSPVMYVLDNCSSKVIPYCKGKIVYEVSVGECDCDECECACCKDDKSATTTTSSKSVYKINNKEVTKKEFDKKYEEFEEMYLDNIRDMMLNYCEFMDEINEWRSKLLRW